jgi:hypothetical protein
MIFYMNLQGILGNVTVLFVVRRLTSKDNESLAALVARNQDLHVLAIILFILHVLA